MNSTLITYKQYKQVAAIALLGLALIPGFYLFYQVSLAQNQPKLGIFTPFEAGSVTESVKQIVAQGSSVADTLKEQLNHEFNKLLAQVKEAFPLAPQAWEKALNQLEDLKQKDTLLIDNPVIKNKKGDSALIQQTRQLLASYGIDPSSVIIQTIEEPKNASYAFAGQCIFNNKVEHYLQLNLAQLLKQTPAVQEALLRHEIMHLINYDPLTFIVIEDLLREHGITDKEFWLHDAYRALNKHIEFRADLMAASHDVAVAQALKDGFEEHMSRYNDAVESKSHPTCKRRYAAIDNLVHYMHAESQLV